MHKVNALSKQEKIDRFDPNAAAATDNLFGLPFTYAESETVVLPVPWEATVSFESGTARAPSAILEVSSQVDLFDPYLAKAWQRGIYMAAIDGELSDMGIAARRAYKMISESHQASLDTQPDLSELNELCEAMVEWVRKQSNALLDEGKRVILLGGDHSTPLGFMKALADRNESFGILQIDAHADLRLNYEGLRYSHASIMKNALDITQVSNITQVGVRDYCEEEFDCIQNESRVKCYFDQDIKHRQYEGESWSSLCQEMVSGLPGQIYVSFDIDGLSPYLCPDTGTPVPGGFEMEEILFLIKMAVDNGKKIIGADISEVSPKEGHSWNQNVGARLLYRLCNLMALSNEN